ncbi:MAG TPA: thioredoxin [Thermoanaerobaculia bacterium]
MERGIVRCPKCGQANRVPAGSGGKTIRCGKCRTELGAPAGGGAPVTLTDASFTSRAGAESRMVVDFWAAWCGPCRIIAPVIESLAAARGDVVFAKVNVDENPRTAATFGIQSIPTLVFLANGREKGRLVGAVGEGQIRQAIAQYLA